MKIRERYNQLEGASTFINYINVITALFISQVNNGDLKNNIPKWNSFQSVLHLILK